MTITRKGRHDSTGVGSPGWRPWGMQKLLWMAMAIAAAACGGDDIECAMGELTGTWRVSYTETDGDCGPISDETVIFNPGGDTGACDVRTQQISDDQCRMDQDFTCPLADGMGTQSWVIVWTQVGDDAINGAGTVQIQHSSLGVCRSTYQIRVRRI